jgi:ActR/RegA family two-component response regulator
MLCSLLISRDENAVRVLSRVFKDLEVKCEHSSESAAALQTISKHRFDAVVIDDALAEAASILAKVLEAPGYSKSVRILLADPQSSSAAAFKGNTQVILYKPLSAERVRHGLKAVRNLMARDRRRGMKRIATMISARVRYGRSSGSKVFISDLSDSGAAIQCSSDIPNGNVHIDFALPDDSDRIHVTAELVWRDNQGAAGVRFLDMATSARKNLGEWLKQEAAKASEAGRFALARKMGL